VLGLSSQCLAVGSFSDGSVKDMTAEVVWSSESTSVATVSNSVGSQGMTTTVAVGTTNITASLDGVSSNVIDYEVVVPSLSTITIAPLDETIPQYIDLQYSAMGIYTDGSSIDITNDVLWSSTSETIATIDPTGLATGVSVGDTTISATLDGISASTTLTVTTATLVFRIEPKDAHIANGTDIQFYAYMSVNGTHDIDVTEQTAWYSSNDKAATISNVAGDKGLAEGDLQGIIIDNDTTDILGEMVYDGTLYSDSTNLDVLDLSKKPDCAVVVQDPDVLEDPAIVYDINVTQRKRLNYIGIWVSTGACSYDASAIVLTQDLTRSIKTSWKSKDKKVVSVDDWGDNKGQIKGESVGSAQIEAKYRKTSASRSVNVN